MANNENKVNNKIDAQVESFSTVYNADGTASDIAVVNVNGQRMAMQDVNKDGIVDYMVVDANSDGIIDESEMIDVQAAGMQMSDFHPDVEPEAEETKEPEISLQSVTTVYNEDGTSSEVAVLDVDGQQVVVMDEDNDGKVDVIASDLNGDGIIDADEVQNVGEHNIAMADIKDLAPTPALEPQVNVLASGTLNVEGQNIDVVVLEQDGQTATVVDADQDGIADLAFSDVNGDGLISDDEIVDLTGEDLAMTDMGFDAPDMA